MAYEFISNVRREQTRQQLELVSSSISDEVATFIKRDALGLHKTQFESVKEVLEVAAKELATHLKEIPVEDLDIADVYDECRNYDEAIIWLQRLWDYLKQKFDQRHKEEEVSKTLKAADEVIWSCFHSVMTKALGQHGPAPLAYIEPEYSPATIQTEKPLPVQLRLEVDLDFLDECLETLPIPVLRLPPTCVSSPWWLVFIAHEVGHHVQYALDLIAHFREGLSAAAQAQKFLKTEADGTWGTWGEEIFADVFSIMMMGQFALRGMVELETGAFPKMVRRKTNYPSPVVRLALMKSVADALGLNTAPELLNLDLQAIAKTDPTSAKDYGVVPEATKFVLEQLPDKRFLKDLCDFDKTIFAEGAKISGWGALLSSQNKLILNPGNMLDLETARDIVCGSLKAWTEHSQRTNAADPELGYSERSEKRETIKKQTIEALLQSGPRETRAGQTGVALEPEKPGKKLAELLRGTSKRFPRTKGEEVAVQG